MIRILHTADWHIGKQLHKQDLAADLELFFDWLIKIIDDEKIDVLLVSGDVFDLANPSNADEAQYFRILSRLVASGVKTIITGGNHDSVSLLDAPTPILQNFNISVIGGCRIDINEEIVPIYNSKGNLTCIVLAVPFLREKDLRSSVRADQVVDRHSMIKESIINHYKSLVNVVHNEYGKEFPVIAMGHLFMSGSITSDGERDIHVGTLDALKDDWIDECGIDYMALGHIHKPQRIGKRNHVRYCGSPIFLDFSEREYQKQCIIIDVENSNIADIRSISIPAFRKMLKLSGKYKEVTEQLTSITSSENLPTLIEVEILMADQDVEAIRLFENFISENASDHYIVLKQKFVSDKSVEKKIQIISEKSISDLEPLEVFEQRLSSEEIDETLRNQVISCYKELYESVY